LYFFVRYPALVSRQSFPEDRLKILLDWHKSAKPSRYECHRNQAIFQKQGNRNPFIDHPGWATAIFGPLLPDSDERGSGLRRGRGGRR
jgi:endonuclease G